MEAENLYATKHGIPREDDKYEKEVYNELYGKIRDKIMEEHAHTSKDFWVLPHLGKKDEPSAASKDTPTPSVKD